MAAMMFATIAFSIDAMLPALPEIGQELSPDNLNRAQMILTIFVLGMGIGTLFTGPLSDRFGRKPVIVGGALVYIAASATAWAAQSLELVLAARLVQGLGAAGPRVVTLAIIRDLYEGREMARLMSFVMLIFTLVPAIAPSLGAVVIAFSSWRGVFVCFVIFSLISTIWLMVRQRETLPPDQRRPFRLGTLSSALMEMLAHPTVRISMAVQTLAFGLLFTMLTMVQQLYDITFGRGDTFPLWFGAIAIVAGSSSLLNAALVMRLGMRRLVTTSFMAQILFSGAMILLCQFPVPTDVMFGAFVFWQTTVFFQAGMTIGNLNAMGMEPMGHMAGTAASVMGAVATILAAVLAIPVGLMFDGTPLPLAIAIFTASVLAVLLMRHLAQLEARMPV